MTEKRCHICGKEVRENYYLDERGYTCYLCSRAIVENKRKVKRIIEELERKWSN